jgi:hypothetical protein
MKKFIFLLLVLFTFTFIDAHSIVVLQRVYFTGNNICNYFQNTGILNQNTASGNMPGFYWHCDPEQHYCFTSGFNIATKINGQLAMITASYKGEWAPGYYNDSSFVTNSDIKIYKVCRTDNAMSNPDYANWYKMIPFGAPYEDVNNNCMFDRDIDKPGVPDAYQTLFFVMCDGDVSMRSPGEGFGGGITYPLLGAEVHLTAWAYNIYLEDVQFLRYQVINKSNNIWDSTFFTLFVDPDSPNTDMDLVGCDTTLQLGYNYSNDTATYAAYGVQVLQGPINKISGDTLRMTSFNLSHLHYACNDEPNGEPIGAYNYMKGFKTDGTSFLDPTTTPYKKTKFVFSGDPETNTGWTPSKGFIKNCNGTDTGSIVYLSGYDTKFQLNTGAGNFKVMPKDTQNIYYSQLIAKGFTNKNSVTKLKALSYAAKTVFKIGIIEEIERNCSLTIIPDDFSLSQNFPNPFNSQTVIKYTSPRSAYIKITIYDLLGREVAIPVNGQIPAGYHDVNVSALNLSSGIYFYRMQVIDNSVNNSLKTGRVHKMVVVK